ncbi:MAG: DUF4405 domain-containing protein [Bacteroidales bacterium]|nr:DUF4405 domain-containing protein [Bacteroidales bacterium]
MKRSKLNLVIDAIMLIVMMAIIGIGLLTKYILLTGQEKWDKFGENLEFTLLGLDRHGWNDIHFIFGLILFGLLVLHIWFHWSMIICIYKGLIKNKKARVFSAIALSFISLVLVAFPLFINAKVEDPDYKGGRHYSEISDTNERKTGEGRQRLKKQEPVMPENSENISRQVSSQIGESKTDKRQHQAHSSNRHADAEHDKRRDIPSNIEVNGRMTLKEIAEEYKVPADHIKTKLNIPLSTSNNERLGRLKKVHDFTMSDVEEIIYEFQKNK